jgi:large subunit ribosomal protein L31e
MDAKFFANGTKKIANSFPQGTTDVRIDPQLNKKVWEQGVKGVAYRIRVRISRRRNDEEGAKEKLYSYVQAVNVKNPKGLATEVVEE